jgi:vacuolar-type H+-ATPase subunit F/Vma7
MRVAFVGDRYSALGFRLAGAKAHVPKPHETQRLLEHLHETVEMMLLTPAVAEHARPDWLAAALAQPHPLMLIVPDASGLQPPPDVAARIRRVLGVESN